MDMNMNVKSSLIRKYRMDRFWSQEHLAGATGLGLRTVQRVESNGRCSPDSLKALAAVFEVSPDVLIKREQAFQPYEHRQIGLAMLLIMPTAMALLLAVNYFVSLPHVLLGGLLCSLTAVTLLFSSMTIRVDESEVMWFFGPGVFKKRVALSDIHHCKTVKNPIWMGLGIHAFGTGWIYNVSGLLGVELELTSGAFIRLGSDQPNYVVRAIVDAQDNRESQGDGDGKH